MRGVLAGFGVLLLAIGLASGADSFYKNPPLFNFWHPQEKSAKQFIDRFGPVGMSVELRLPPFQMYVGKIEEGSPAGMMVKLKTGQKIDSINGQVLRDIDPRIQLAKFISDAEAKDGKIRFMIREEEKSAPYEVIVSIPILGAYSETWPLNCKKSDRIAQGHLRI
jgi:hypothetical protein